MSALPLAPAAAIAILCGLVAPARAAEESPVATPPPREELETQVHSRALELAGAFSNDGYKIRDGFWFAPIDADQPQMLEVNLFAGNEYWFCATVNPPGSKIGIDIFDEKGAPVGINNYEDGPTTARGVEPAYSGKYFVQVRLLDGTKSDFGLIYCYK